MSITNKDMRFAPEQHTHPAIAGEQSKSPTIRNLATLLVFILGFSPISLNWAEHKSKPIPEPIVNSQDLPNFHVVDSYFYRGAAPSFAGMDQLKRLGIRTVIDLRRTPVMIEAERSYLKRIGVEYVSIPMGNWVPSVQKQQLFIDIMTRASQDSAKAPVFLHCAHGSDRTGFLTAMWRVQHDHWSIFQAAAEMLHRGFFIHKFEPNPASRIDY